MLQPTRLGSPWCDSNPNSIYNGGRCTVALLPAQETNATEAIEEEDQSDQVDEVDQVQLAAQVSDVSTAVLANGALSLDMIITRRIFDKIFPETEGSVFTYDGLLEAAQSYSEFAQTPNADINVLEVAYFLAHVAYTTEDLA